MKKAFRDAYNRELSILKERSAEFAADYPGLADRLGGLVEDNMDPSIGGLLEGTAFLAARVQVKMDEEFRTFTHEMLDQVFPDALAPTPSAMLVQAKPPYENKDIAGGLHFEAGEYMDARFVDADKRVACRFSLRGALSLWPLSIDTLRYHAAPGTLGALGQDVTSGTKAGLEIGLTRVNAAGKPDRKAPLSELPLDELPFHFTAPADDEAIELYEQVHAGLLRASLRYLDKNGDAKFLTLAAKAVEQIGFDDQPPLYPPNGTLFSGYSLLREAFVFPRKFIGFKLVGLRQALRRIRTGNVQILLEFDRSNAKLAARLESDHVQLFCAPAVNLFEESSSQVRLNKKRTEFVVTPDRSPLTHYEIYQIKEVFAHYAGHQRKEKVLPLYGLPPDGIDPKQALHYTSRQKPRRLTEPERRFGASKYRYRGSETFISIYEPPEGEPAQRLQVRALCSNRHLTEYLPIARSKDEFRLCEDQTVTLACLSGPTAPRESLLDIDNRAAHRAADGDGHWRLISFLSLNFHGLLNDRSGKGAAPLRELLSLFANLSDSVTQAHIDGLKSVETRPVVRTIKREDGFHPARGLMVTLTLDEDEFEGSGAFLLGAILDRFLSEYAAVNSFTQCQVASVQRGIIKTFPPRSGTGPLL